MTVTEGCNTGVSYYLADFFGHSEPAIRLLLSLFVGYPLALFYRHVLFGTAPVIQNLFFTLCGITIGFYNYGLSWDVYDGQKSEVNLSEEQKETALKRCPSLLEIGGHAYFSCGFLVSSQFPMKRYLNLVEGKFKEKILNGNPDCVSAGLKRMFQAILIFSVYIIGNRFFPEKVFYSHGFEEFPSWKKILIIVICSRLYFCRYAAVWILSEGSLILTGLTYKGTDKNGKDLWDGCIDVKLWQFATTSTIRGIIGSFHCNTNLWIKQYVYKRLKFLGNRHISQALTLLFLAVWHGWHSGYYVLFFNEFLCLLFEKDFEAFLSTRFPKAKEMLLQNALKYPVGILIKVYLNVILGYVFLPFMFLTWSRYMQVYRSVYFYGHIVFGWILVSPFLRALIPKAKVQKAE
ncbi:unnamed protein product [Larinioides sclopetarius]|uniref:Lysophospholipid acyltransferase 5 n=1 Tax=Larinioides sclopetarius TaxID=280406 RepID=A0AAV2AD76_9ARAC